eukprot:CAMPEP_0170567932 /NCGR_PEP_ID=MMETSP0211-20121228/80800_1 /TAXON_ID=311385 /ORGANISM="Pseudokeronopsis sp., Strain OXSARD2" /LENGTH=74 /DNA_ID=CAMNT_0010889541 /DNA_START=1489 /DNA_END=1713 /DNA_ORIENTATION=+
MKEIKEQKGRSVEKNEKPKHFKIKKMMKNKIFESQKSFKKVGKGGREEANGKNTGEDKTIESKNVTSSQPVTSL